MFDIDLSVGDFDGYAVVTLCGGLDLFGTSDVPHTPAARPR